MWFGALVAAACAPVSSGDGSTGSTGEGETTTAVSTSSTSTSAGGTTSGTSTGGSSSGGSTVGSTSASSTGSDTTADTSTGGSSSEGGSSTTATGPNQGCVDGCVTEFACGRRWRSEDACVEWCEANLVQAEAEAGPACRISWENLYECLGTLTCEEYEQWQMPVEVPYPCISEDEALTFECAGQ